jgi:hypothetical protein
LRYASVSGFERADLDAPVIGRLGQGDVLVILGSEAECYGLALADGRHGFDFAHNSEGNYLPLTADRQRTADGLAARQAQRPTGWRGVVNRFRESVSLAARTAPAASGFGWERRAGLWPAVEWEWRQQRCPVMHLTARPAPRRYTGSQQPYGEGHA